MKWYGHWSAWRLMGLWLGTVTDVRGGVGFVCRAVAGPLASIANGLPMKGTFTRVLWPGD